MQRGVLAVAWAVALLIGAPALALPADQGVDLGGVFGTAVARATSLSPDTIQLELEVEADEDAALVAHLIDPGGSQETIPLSSRGTGLFGIRTEVRKTDYLVVFEALEGSLASQSQPFRLTDLGVDPALLGVLTLPTSDAEEISASTRQWGWAGLGLAATALTLVALWALPDRRRRSREAEEAVADPDDLPAAEPETAEPRPSPPTESDDA